MTGGEQRVFADTSFWIALVLAQDRHHAMAGLLARDTKESITTTEAVLLETANSLSRPAWRAAGIALIDHLRSRPDVRIVPFSADLWSRSWRLYCDRPDKGWSLTDCASFLVMQDGGMTDALTADEHFAQAGFRARMRD